MAGKHKNYDFSPGAEVIVMESPEVMEPRKIDAKKYVHRKFDDSHIRSEILQALGLEEYDVAS